MAKIDIKEFIEIEDLSADMQVVAEACGIEVARILVEKCASLRIHIPKFANLRTSVVKAVESNQHLRPTELARSLQVSLSTVENVQRERRNRRKSVANTRVKKIALPNK